MILQNWQVENGYLFPLNSLLEDLQHNVSSQEVYKILIVYSFSWELFVVLGGDHFQTLRGKKKINKKHLYKLILTYQKCCTLFNIPLFLFWPCQKVSKVCTYHTCAEEWRNHASLLKHGCPCAQTLTSFFRTFTRLNPLTKSSVGKKPQIWYYI